MRGALSAEVTCPSPETLLEHGDAAHVDGCLECQLVIAELGSSPRGKRIGRYRLEHVVGSGGMGVIYAAFDEELQRTVALKLIRPEVAASPHARARLVREAQALAQVSHPNVVTVFEAGVDGDDVFIALELVTGANLRTRLDRCSQNDAVELVLAAAEGLTAIHAAGLVHRDVKPENILVGMDGRVRVGDLGLARIDLDDGAPPIALDDALTCQGATPGTLAYMAPEQLAGLTADARADQFALCVVLYEALYGEYPFASRTERTQLLPAPRSARVPGWLRRLVVRGLAVDPADRHGSVRALLDAIAAGRRRRRYAMHAGALAAAAAVAAGVVSWHGVSTATTLAPSCDGGARKVARTWNEPRQHHISDAFTRTHHPEARTRFATLAATVDRYAADLVTTYTETCRATHDLGEQSPARLDERTECLDTRLRELEFHLALYDVADHQRVERSSELAQLLVPLDTCRDPSASKEPGPTGAASGLVSNFDDGTSVTAFGVGWAGVTDRIFGGSSDVELAVHRDGAEGSAGALSITGEVKGAQSMRWAGAMFSPAGAVGEPVNLSTMRRIEFWARGDNRTYGVAMFSRSLGRMPSVRPFAVTSTWQKFALPLSSFPGLTTYDLSGLMFTTNEQPGAFSLDIDGVKFAK